MVPKPDPCSPRSPSYTMKERLAGFLHWLASTSSVEYWLLPASLCLALGCVHWQIGRS